MAIRISRRLLVLDGSRKMKNQKEIINREIRDILKKIEEQEGIIILFAVENGSRAWGIESKDSDYDIRFVFKKPIRGYLSNLSKQEVITYTKGKIDIVGFDIKKYFFLLSKSNPVTIEWLLSKMVYYGKQPKELKEFITKGCNLVALYHHYRSMCKQNYLKYIRSKENTSFKKYLYTFRGLVNAKYIQLYEAIPPMDFQIALTKTRILEGIDATIEKDLLKIIKVKKQGAEKEIHPPKVFLNEYVEKFLKESEIFPLKKDMDFGWLDRYMIDLIQKKHNPKITQAKL